MSNRCGQIGRAVLLMATIAAVPATNAAVIANDGGVTLWISYEGALTDTVTESDSPAGGFSCGATNTGRSGVGAPNSPPSCPATGTCTADEKISGDLTKLADYIFTSTEGEHYLRRAYVSVDGRAWDSADIKWFSGGGGSTAPGAGWADVDRQLNLKSTARTCIHDVLHHELGHYIYNLPDRYARSTPYYYGSIGGGASFDVDVTERDVNTVMSNNFPHLFVDTTNARIVVDYDPPSASAVTGEVLTPDLLADANGANDGPDRAHHGHTHPFAQDEWSLLDDRHADLAGVHTEGTFPAAGATPAVDIVFVGDDEPHPGTVLLLDRSGSMSVTTDGVTAAQFVQEAGMFLYHSAETDEFVGTYLYNDAVEELFEYAEYDPANDLAGASFRSASGLTNIAAALERAIDELIAEHGEGSVNGAEIYLMSDGKQTTGSSLWDQVDRAEERGIRINTFSFGNADATTMTNIASGASGDNVQMSEREDAAELKQIMTLRFSEGRGYTPIHVFKGPMKESTTLANTQVFVRTFDVPKKSRKLQFYAFLPTQDTSQLRLRLTDPDGAHFDTLPANNVAQKGRFNGLTVPNPKPGTWRLVVSGPVGGGLPNEPIEIDVQADNRNLSGRIWFEDLKLGQNVKVRATLEFGYPLTDIDVAAVLFARGQPIGSLQLFDDGDTGGDELPRDGVYSAELRLDGEQPPWLRSAIAGGTTRLRAQARFSLGATAIPAPGAHYETGFTPTAALENYDTEYRSEFTAFATRVLNVDPAQGKKDPTVSVDTRPGGGTVEPGGRGQIRVVVDQARPSVDILRVSLGAGVKVDVQPAPDDPDNPNLHGVFVVDYEVGADAPDGPRKLKVQFGLDVLEVPGTVIVVADGRGDTPDDKSSVPWLWILVVLILLIIAYLVWRNSHNDGPTTTS